MAKSYTLGIDVGGTFTDFVLLDEVTGEQLTHKRLTTPDDPARAIVDGFTEVTRQADIHPSRVHRLIHGTTLVVNTLIERKGARVALLCTKGFEDLLDIRRESRWDMYDLAITFPAPLVEESARVGAPERTYADGTRELDEAGLTEAVSTLLELAPESVAVCFLHSHIDATNERAAAAIVEARDGELPVTLSSSLLPEIGEYERLTTTVANAYVHSLTKRYLERLSTELRKSGFEGETYLMLSHGGLGDLATGSESPIRLLESGPAGGCKAGVFYSERTGVDNLIVFDMGGTTAKASLVEDGESSLVTEIEVARQDRYRQGSGLPIKVTCVDLLEIGAGGGSVARVDDLGLIKVGPDSAGADPGPACYGLGGRLPTVTDADLVLGYLSASSFLGGEMALDVELAAAAITEQIADPLGLSLPEAAWGIHRIVNRNMAEAARLHVVEKARDPSEFLLVCMGGAGPTHACRVAEEINARGVLAPAGAGVKSAMGFLVSPLSVDFVRYERRITHSLGWGDVDAIFRPLERQAEGRLARGGVSPDDLVFRRVLEMRYVGQGRQVTVECPGYGEPAGATIEDVFEQTYGSMFGRREDGLSTEVVTWRLYASGPTPQPPEPPRSIASAARGPTDRPAYFPELSGYATTPVYDRASVEPGSELVGPAIVEELASTLVIPPGLRGIVDDHDILRIEASPMAEGRVEPNPSPLARVGVGDADFG